LGLAGLEKTDGEKERGYAHSLSAARSCEYLQCRQRWKITLPKDWPSFG
jgi:hypothetical protein